MIWAPHNSPHLRYPAVGTRSAYRHPHPEINPTIAVEAKGKHYKPVFDGPDLAVLEQGERQWETPQMKYLPYRRNVRPGIDPTYGKISAEADPHGDFKP